MDGFHCCHTLSFHHAIPHHGLWQGRAYWQGARQQQEAGEPASSAPTIPPTTPSLPPAECAAAAYAEWMKAAKINTACGEAFRCLGDYFAGLDAEGSPQHKAGAQGDGATAGVGGREGFDAGGGEIRRARHRDVGRAVKCYQRAVTIDPLDSHAGVRLRGCMECPDCWRQEICMDSPLCFAMHQGETKPYLIASEHLMMQLLQVPACQ